MENNIDSNSRWVGEQEILSLTGWVCFEGGHICPQTILAVRVLQVPSLFSPVLEHIVQSVSGKKRRNRDRREFGGFVTPCFHGPKTSSLLHRK